jgi:phospholipase/carboxylesterase
MLKNPHLLTRVECYGVPRASASAVVVLVHGRTLSPEYMNEHVVHRLSLTELAFVAPAADNNTWYPSSFLNPLADNQPSLDFAFARLDAIKNELAGEGVPPEKIFWCGFSQGACLISEFLFTQPQRWGGIIAFTGGLIGPPDQDWVTTGDFAGTPAYFTTSEADPFVPESRVRETASRFSAAGALVSVELHLGRAHEICDAEIDRARFILQDRSS